MEMGFLPEEFKNLDEKIYNMKMSSLEVTDLILTIQETYGIVIQTSDIPVSYTHLRAHET